MAKTTPAELIERSKTLVASWDEGKFDNAKDAILECTELLGQLPSRSTSRKPVQRVLYEAGRILLGVAGDDPNQWTDADRMLIELTDVDPRTTADAAREA